jgi:hypothetical protein
MERSPEEVTTEPNRVLEEKAETKTEVGTCSHQPPNQTVQFPKLDHPILSSLGQKITSRTTAPGMAPTPHWCPPGLMPNQRRRI